MARSSSTLTASQIKSTLTKHAKVSGRSSFIIGTEDDGTCWYTNSYYAAKVEATAPGTYRPVAVQFMDAYNLDARASGVYPCNGTVAASTQEGPRMSSLIPKADVWTDTERIEVAGCPAFVILGKDWLCRLYGPSPSPIATDKPIAINDDYASWLEKTAGVTAWKSQGDNVNKPLGGFNDAGELVAIVMPVRIH